MVAAELSNSKLKYVVENTQMELCKGKKRGACQKVYICVTGISGGKGRERETEKRQKKS